MIACYCADNPDGQVALASTVRSTGGDMMIGSDSGVGTFGSQVLKSCGKVSSALAMALLVQGNDAAKEKVDAGVMLAFINAISTGGDAGAADSDFTGGIGAQNGPAANGTAEGDKVKVRHSFVPALSLFPLPHSL